MKHKVCSKCGVKQKFSEFLWQRRDRINMTNSSYCRTCRKKQLREYHKKYWKLNSESIKARVKKWRERTPHKYAESSDKYNKKYPERHAANRYIRYEIIRGRLKKKPCKKCGETHRVQAHHEDYSKPADIVWLCPKHHRARHRELAKAK